MTLAKNVCFIHSTNIATTGTFILDMMISYLNERNFIDALEFLVINNIGEPLDEDKYAKIHKKIVVINYSEDASLFENATMKQVITFSKIHDDYNVLYMHTKGVSYKQDHYFYQGILSWINFMMYCLVDHSDKCVDLLSDYDTIGTNVREHDTNPLHYSGNFWWARTSYLRKLPITIFKDKYDCEFQIMSKNPRFFNVWTLNQMYQTVYPLSTYESDVISSFVNGLSIQNETRVNFCGIGSFGSGLCNQINSLVAAICKCIAQNKDNTINNLIIVNDFSTDYKSPDRMSSNLIFDIESLNDYLQKYNIYIIDKNDIRMNIDSVKYGTEDIFIDLTDVVKDKFYRDNILKIDRNFPINELKGDPVPNVKKTLKIRYSLNNLKFKFTQTFQENEFVYIDYSNVNHKRWVTTNTLFTELQENREIVEEILSNIQFHKTYMDISAAFMQSLNIPQDARINVLHIRNEDDAIEFWGMINRFGDLNNFKDVLEDKYMQMIDKYVDSDSYNIVLSANTNNRIIDHLQSKTNGRCIFTDKTEHKGREINAMIDMIIAQNCNNIFIGCVNPETYHGSTYSGMLYSIFKKKQIKNILIDLDDIHHDERIVSNP